MLILSALLLHVFVALHDCHDIGHDNDSPNGWSRELKEDMMPHAGLPGTQHGKEPHHPEYFTTNSRLPILPSLTGFVGTHGTYRHLTIHEQTAILIGDGKHGVWRVQESGFIRSYRKKDMEGILANSTKDLNDLDLNKNEDMKLYNLLKDNYAAYIKEEGLNGYKHPDENESEDGYLNFVDLTIYHPIYEGKYDDHVPIDLPHFFCTMPGPDIPHVRNVWNYGVAQPEANKLGPLAIRAGLDIKELYPNTIRFNFMGDAGVYANIGQGTPETDKVHATLDDLRDRAQTLNFQRVDLSKVDHEMYLFERPFFNRRFIFINIIFDNADKDYSYVRPDGAYHDALVAKGTDMSGYPKDPDHFPPFPIVNEADKKEVIGTGVYGHHHPARQEHGQQGGACPSKGGDLGRYPWGNHGASWPTTLEEVTPVCDGLLVDVKMYYDLDKSWNDPTIGLGNGGFHPAQVTNYTVDLNKYGYYTDPYLIAENKVNPYAMDLTPDGNEVANSDDAHDIENLRLDFGAPGEHLTYVEPEGLDMDEIEHIQGDKTMMEYFMGHAGAEGTQHAKEENDTRFYETNSRIPILPSVSGFMATHATHRHVTVHEQTIVMIGEIKHGVWRIQENGMVRHYLKKGMVGVSNGTKANELDASKSEDKLKLDILKKNYAAFIPEEGFSGYKYPDEEVSEEGYLNFVDLTIYHPQFEGKYDNHTVIDLAHFMCTMPQPHYPHAHNVWKYATKQKRANQLGPLAIRAGMDIKEHYTNVVRFDFIGDAGLWVNVGTGDPATDNVHKTLNDLRDRAQTLNYKKADLSKMNFEMYLFERPFFNLPYLFISIVVDLNDNFRYLRPAGPYYDELVARNIDIASIPDTEEHFPKVHVEGEADEKKVIGTSVYGHHHPARQVHGQRGGACPSRGGDLGRYPWGNGGGSTWPNTYQEITPVCDGFLVDVKGHYDLDKPWESDDIFLGNAGFKPAQVTNYTVDLNIYGQYEDPYLVQENKVNPYKMDLTPDNQFVESSDDAHPIEKLQLDFNIAGDYLEFVEAKDLRPDVPKRVIDPLPKSETMDEGDNVELRFVVRNEKDLYSCCSEQMESCLKQSCEPVPGSDDQCHFVANVRRDRGFCGHQLTYRRVDLHKFHDIKFFFNFRPHAPKVKHAKYDTKNNCLIIQIEPEDTGRCELRYTFEYKYAEFNKAMGEITGTKEKLENIELKTCFEERKYDEDYKPRVHIRATSTVGDKQFGEETEVQVQHFDPETKDKECPKQEL